MMNERELCDSRYMWLRAVVIFVISKLDEGFEVCRCGDGEVNLLLMGEVRALECVSVRLLVPLGYGVLGVANECTNL